MNKYPQGNLPILPIKNAVLFPSLLMPLTISRPRSIAALDKALSSEDKFIAVFTQRDSAIDVPTADDLYEVGTMAVIKKMTRIHKIINVEAVLLPHGKDLLLTGQLGEVMQESAKAARSYIWSKSQKLGVDRETISNNGVHIHVPSGAVPKDGPSAGVTMLCALFSAYVGIPVKSDTAMTGEITLSGLVLPVGGIKEKALAAYSSGIHRIILPLENKKDLVEIPEQVTNKLEYIFVDNAEQVLNEAIPQFSNEGKKNKSAGFA